MQHCASLKAGVCTFRLDHGTNPIARLKQENIFLLAAIKRYDSAVMSLREVISVMAAQTIKSGDGKTVLEEQAQFKLKQVLDSLMRVKDDQVRRAADAFE